ncbi:MAG: pyridoxamine kinase [Clostridiales bacterium]|nr:pyridoxamine kinase [Clostridiales bacterium]
MQKRVLAVHDISCVGRCSLTVALPILSAAGINTSVIPTALLSTHTGEFTGYTHLDLSDQLLPIARHLSTLGLGFDAIYTGYLASGSQTQQVLDIIELLAVPQTHLFVDPAFADDGRLYSLLDDTMPAQMRRLCARAHTIVPNLTEAAFLLSQPYPGKTYSPAYVSGLAKALLAMGPQNVIITDVSFDSSQTGIAIIQQGMDEPSFTFTHRYPGTFHGTGDVFASFLLGALLRDMTLPDAADMALSLTHDSIALTLQENQPLRYGVQFERVTSRFLRELECRNRQESCK